MKHLKRHICAEIEMLNSFADFEFQLGRGIFMHMFPSLLNSDKKYCDWKKSGTKENNFGQWGVKNNFIALFHVSGHLPLFLILHS